MSIKKLYSNELLASFEYSNIDKDYEFLLCYNIG